MLIERWLHLYLSFLTLTQSASPEAWAPAGVGVGTGEVNASVLTSAFRGSAQNLVFGNSGSVWLMILRDSALCRALRKNDLSWGAQPNNGH